MVDLKPLHVVLIVFGSFILGIYVGYFIGVQDMLPLYGDAVDVATRCVDLLGGLSK